MRPIDTCLPLAAAALLLTCAPMHPAAAQVADTTPCRDMLASMTFVQPEAKARVAVTRPDPQTCRFSPIRLNWVPSLAWEADSMTIRGALTPNTSHDAPVEVQIEDRGVRIVPAVANPVARYLLKVGADPFDVDLDYVTDQKARTVLLRRFEMRGDALGHLELHAALTGVAPPADPLDGSKLNVPDIAEIGLGALSFRLDKHGFIEHMVTPMLVGVLADSTPQSDPELAVEAEKRQVEAVLQAAPALVGLAPGTADALARFVADFPHPSGSLRCDASADPPLKLPVDGPTIPALRSMVQAAHPTCTYVRP